MKKSIALLLALVMVLCLAALTGCGETTDGTDASKVPESNTFEIAVVTDVGQLMDKGFNQGTYEGAQTYAEANGLTYKYYQPANGSNASDNDRVAAMNQAIENGAKIIVAPGFLQATAMTQVALANPEVKFLFVDGWALTDAEGKIIPNVTAITYKEEESGYMAGYAAVMEGYTKLGFVGGGGGTNPACNRFGYGFVQGAEAAAVEKNVTVDVKFSFNYGGSFSASTELQTQCAGWYAAGTEVIFSCGGSMFDSVKSAAAEYENAKIIGVDSDQSGESDRVITSAVKDLPNSVSRVLGQFYAGKWDEELSGKAQNLGAAEDSTGLPTDTWSMVNFTLDQYNTMFASIKDGSVKIDATTPDDCNADSAWLTANLTKVTVDFVK